MADYPRASATRNCSHCHFYRPPDDAGDGVCMRTAPTGEGNVAASLLAVGDEFSPISLPDAAWCGDFRPYAGSARS